MNWKLIQSWLVIGLLFSLVLLQGAQLVGNFLEKRECATALEQSKDIILAQEAIYLDLMQSYEKAAYANPSVDRIAEQQLLASESQLTALQVLASQNGVLIDLLAACP